ncbi:MAG: hypothetical protein ACK5VV_13770 [Lysobacteraceae bacterium]
MKQALESRPLAVAAVFTLVALVGGALFAGAPVSADRSGSDAAWRLPEATALRRFDPADVTTMRSSTFWSTAATADDGGIDAPAAAWTLAGIVRDGERWLALVATPGNALDVKRLAAGEALPDGRSIIAIDAARMQVDAGACRIDYTLYAPRPAGGCADDTQGP